MPGPTVFVSCVSKEFEDEGAPFVGLRGRLRHYLAKARRAPDVQEDFPQTDEDTVLKVAGFVRASAQVIHLVGERPGAVAHPQAVAEFLAAEPTFLDKYPELRAALCDGSGVTYTQWEAYLALHYGVSLRVYATTPGAKAVHLDRLKLARRYASVFRDEAHLLGQLIGDLREDLPALGAAVQRIAKPRFIHHTAEFFLGREDELALLDRAWADGTHVLSVIAWGGVGKTALLSHWLQTRFIDEGWKDAAGTPSPLAYFDWSFYDQGTRPSADATAVRTGSVGDFFEQALVHLGDKDVTKPGKGARLAGLVRQTRMLFVLDGLEPLQYPVGTQMDGRLLDPDLRDFITMLAQANPGLLVITSRQALTDLGGLSETAARSRDLDNLPREVAIRLLRRLMIAGSDAELGEASEKFGHHALSLTLLGRFLFDAHPILAETPDGKKEKHGDIRRIDQVDLKEADDLTRGDRHRTAWKVLEAYEGWLSQPDGNPKTLAVLRLTGLFDRTATAGCLNALRAEPVIVGLTDVLVGMKPAEWNSLLGKLERAHLLKLKLEADGGQAVDAHPLIREFFAHQLKKEQPEAFKAAHSRLFDHLCTTTPPRPDGLEGLQPLYQAVIHGCQAGRQEEACQQVYIERILRGTENRGYYSTKTLGAYGADLAAVVAFFDVPWTQVSPTFREADKSWFLGRAAYCLRALGRLTESEQPMRTSLEAPVREMIWSAAAIGAGNLSQLEVTLGRLPAAVDDGRRAVEYADRSGLPFHRMARRAMAADALQQAGRRTEAGDMFVEAEREAANKLLYSIGGHYYCEWLLARAERGAWRALSHDLNSVGPENLDLLTKTCDEVERRGILVLDGCELRQPPLDFAMAYLTLARVGILRAILTGLVPRRALGLPHVAAALTAFRTAGQLQELPRGLLTAALYHFVRGEHDLARGYLDETQQIAERGPMPLFLADAHLHRARMFRDKDELAKAAKLIRDLGYGRRYDELADAEAALA